MTLDVLEELADKVTSTLNAKGTALPSSTILALISTMYFGSMGTEEHASIRCRIVFFDGQITSPDSNPGGWCIEFFPRPIEFNARNLTKVAMALDVRSSALAVSACNGGLVITGVIDQGSDYYQILHGAAVRCPPLPGDFHASIEGVGHVIIYKDFTIIGEVKVSALGGSTCNLSDDQKMPVSLSRYAGCYVDDLTNNFNSRLSSLGLSLGGKSLSDLLHPETFWFDMIRFLLWEMKQYRHGGTLLIGNFSDNQPPSWANIKYKITYSRLYPALRAWNRELLLDLAIRQNRVQSSACSPCLHQIAYDNYRDHIKHRDEMLNCIRFIASLTCVDGAVLIDGKTLAVHGFGAEITESEPPASGALAAVNNDSSLSERSVDYNHYGTRHRSVMRCCWSDANVVGLVVSSDGDVRLIFKDTSQNKLLIREDINLSG